MKIMRLFRFCARYLLKVESWTQERSEQSAIAGEGVTVEAVFEGAFGE